VMGVTALTSRLGTVLVIVLVCFMLGLFR
jgi:hypothetical protein